MSTIVTDEELEALYQTTKQLEGRWVSDIPDAHTFFAYDPLPWRDFIEGVEVFSKHVQGKRFLDIGCGIGTKLAFMHYLGWEVSGIERHGPYVEAARELCPAANIIQADAFDVEKFEADVVSMYRPCVSTEDELRLEGQVASRLVPGTLLFLGARMLSDDLGGEYLGANVWRF